MSHTEPHPLRGQAIMLKVGTTTLTTFTPEDWWDRISEHPVPEELAGGFDPAGMVYGHLSDGTGKLLHDNQLQVLTEDEIIDRWIGADRPTASGNGTGDD